MSEQYDLKKAQCIINTYADGYLEGYKQAREDATEAYTKGYTAGWIKGREDTAAELKTRIHDWNQESKIPYEPIKKIIKEMEVKHERNI